MSWRLLAAAGCSVDLPGIPVAVRAQDDAAKGKETADSKTAAPAEKPASTAEAAAAATKSGEAAPPRPRRRLPRPSPRRSGSDQFQVVGELGFFGAKYELATFGAGCFWHVEADFERLNGVISAVSGYAGGNVRNPNYEMVHEGITGHAEVVMVQYDPEIISYEDLLKVFWRVTTRPRRIGRGPTWGRSIARSSFTTTRRRGRPRWTRITSSSRRGPSETRSSRSSSRSRRFYRAEDEHQDYYGGKPRASSRRKTTSSCASPETAVEGGQGARERSRRTRRSRRGSEAG